MDFMVCNYKEYGYFILKIRILELSIPNLAIYLNFTTGYKIQNITISNTTTVKYLLFIGTWLYFKQ